MELYYRRSETYDRKGRLVPARVETVVIFLPDIRSCQPTRPEWDELHLSYKSHLERIINSQSSDSPVPPAAVATAEEPTDKPIDSATSSTSDSEKPTAAATAEPTTEPAAVVEEAPVVEGTDPADPAAAPKDLAEDDKADVVEITEKAHSYYYLS